MTNRCFENCYCFELNIPDVETLLAMTCSWYNGKTVSVHHHYPIKQLHLSRKFFIFAADATPDQPRC